MEVTCSECSNPFLISEEELALRAKLAPVLNGRRFEIPLPVLCPQHRLQRRWSWRNEKSLYRRASDKSGKGIISMFPPGSRYTVWDQPEWWDDAWDGTEYGRDIDFSRPFFEQFSDLLHAIPLPNLLNLHTANENSDFVNCTSYLKDCYMISDASECQECFHSELMYRCTNCVDCTNAQSCELCSGCIDCIGCYNSTSLIQSEGCSDCYFLYDCKGCKNCYRSAGLRNKEFWWENEQLSKADYQERLKALSLDCHSVFEGERALFFDFLEDRPRKFAFHSNCENSSGNVIFNCKNALEAFDATDLEDCFHIVSANFLKDSIDVEHSVKDELCLELMASVECYNTLFCAYPANTRDVYYSYLPVRLKSCFGCVGLKGQEYCILNKPCSKEEYERLCSSLVEHMIETGEWGQFFPMQLAPHGYNETLAGTYFPLSKIEAQSKGLPWSDYESEPPRVDRTISTTDLSDSINNVDSEIVDAAIICEISGRPFRIGALELRFYTQNGIPLPRLHPEERFRRRLALRAPRRLRSEVCSDCATAIETVYSPGQSRKVLCEDCYLAEIY